MTDNTFYDSLVILKILTTLYKNNDDLIYANCGIFSVINAYTLYSIELSRFNNYCGRVCT